MSETKGTKSYKEWYEEHKNTVLEKRKAKYQTDEAYRAAAQQRAAAAREKRRAKKAPLPPQYTLTHSDVAEALGVSTAVLRGWREKEIYPSPYPFGPKLYFTEGQLKLLQSVAKFFRDNGFKLPAVKKPELENLIALTFANWT